MFDLPRRFLTACIYDLTKKRYQERVSIEEQNVGLDIIDDKIDKKTKELAGIAKKFSVKDIYEPNIMIILL